MKKAITLGRKTFESGYNFKNIVKAEIEKQGIQYTRMVHHIEDPYQYKRYKSEYVGQSVWVYQKDSDMGVLFLQTDFIDTPDNFLSQQIELLLT